MMKNSVVKIMVLGTGLCLLAMPVLGFKEEDLEKLRRTNECIRCDFLAKLNPKTYVYGLDYSSEALKVAKINKEKFNLDNFYLINSNWLEPFKENSFDIVVSNPPYVAPSDPHLEELKHEPILALISEQNGLEDFDLISSQAIKVLKVDGLLAFEHGNNQSNDVKKIMTIYGFKNITLIHDYQSNPRITIGKK